MAIGDKARAAGLQTYGPDQDRRLGYDNDNQNADYIAEDRARLDVLESYSSQAMFSTYRAASTTQTLKHATPLIIAGAFAEHELNQGFAKWDGAKGELTIFRAGVYRMFAHVQLLAPLEVVNLQITRNSTAVDTPNTLTKGETAGPAAEATALRRLDQNDVLRLIVNQRNPAGTDRAVGAFPFDLGYSVEWVRD